MSDLKKGDEESGHPRIRITLTSRNKEEVEKASASLIAAGKKQSLAIKGPVRMPTKHLKLTVRKSPCGNGTNTFDRYEMRIYKRVIDFDTSVETIRTLTKSMAIDPAVQVEVIQVKQ